MYFSVFRPLCKRQAQVIKIREMNSNKQFYFFQIPELFFCYMYVYYDNFEINIV